MHDFDETIPMKYNCLFFIIIAIFCSAVTTSANQNAYEIFKKGIELENSLRIFEARDIFREAIVLDPMNKGYMEHYAWFLHYNGFHEEVVDVFTRLISMAEKKEFIYLGLGWNQKILGRLSHSLDEYKKVFILISPNSNFRNVFREIRWKPYDENRAKIQDLTMKLAEDPQEIGLKKELFEVYINEGDLEGAIKLGEEIVADNSGDKLFHLKFARALFWHNEKNRAEAEYKKLLADSPDNPFLYFELGCVLHAGDRLTEAREALEKSLSLYSASAGTKKELVEVLAKMGKGEEAEKLAAGIKPEGCEKLDGLLARAGCFHFSGRLDEARVLYREVLQDYPYNSDALWGLTETSIYTGNLEDARTTLKKWGSPDGSGGIFMTTAIIT